jgi:hypothetical protein
MEEVDKQQDKVIGKRCDFLLEQVEQVLEVFDDGDISLKKRCVNLENILQVRFNEFNNGIILENTVKSIAGVDFEEAFLLAVAYKKTSVD